MALQLDDMNLSGPKLKAFLDETVERYNRPAFIENDPISIPHQYEQKGDIEIAGFLTATIAWGNRKSILSSANRMMQLMDNSPLDFILNFREEDLKRMEGFVHRTFNATDLICFLNALQHIYRDLGGLETIFRSRMTPGSLQPAIHSLHNRFFDLPHLKRSEKHLPNPFKGSAAKRLNMFLRWMVRRDGKGVDFGIWRSIPPSVLSCPLDVHSGNVARKLGLLTRKQNDARAVAELDEQLRLLDPADPVKYDFALFGLGAIEGF